MDYIMNLLFTLLQIVANDKIINHNVIMILIKAGLMGKMLCCCCIVVLRPR